MGDVTVSDLVPPFLSDRFHLYRIAVRFPRLILVVCLLMALVSIFLARKLVIADLYSGLLPEGTQSVENLRYAEKYFGELGFLVLVIEGTNDEQTETFARAITAKIENEPDVYYVRAPWNFDFLRDNKWLYVDIKDLATIEKRLDQALLLQKQGVNFIFSDLMDFADQENLPDLTFSDIQEKYKKRWSSYLNVSSQNKKTGSILLWVKARGLKKTTNEKSQFVDSIKMLESQIRSRIKGSNNISVGYTGSYQTTIETVATATQEMTVISLAVFLILIGILIAYFRKIRLLLYVGLPLMTGILWTGGLAYLVLGKLNLLTGFAASILAGLGSDYAIYLLTRFDQERAKNRDLDTAIRLTFAGTGRATYLSMLTTLVAFSGLCFSNLNVLFEFGLIGVFGLLMTYLATMLMMPALMCLYEKKQAPVYHARFVPHSGHSTLFKALFFPAKRFSVVGLALLAIMASLPILPHQFKIEFVEDLNSLKTSSNTLYDKVSRTIGATLNPTLLITKSAGENNQLSDDLREALKSESKKDLVFNNIIDFSQIVPRYQGEKKKIMKHCIDKFLKIDLPMTDGRRRLIQEWQNSLSSPLVTENGVTDRIKSFFLSSHDPNVFAAYLFPSFPRVAADAMKRYQDGVDDLRSITKVDFTAVDASFLAADAVALVKQKIPAAMILFSLFLTIILMIMIRPPLLAFLSLVHILASVIITIGVMSIFDISFNILNIGCLPVMIGTGIDVFIHYSYHTMETGSLWEALREEVSPMMMSCLTTIIGFGGLIFSSNSGLRSVGWLAIIGLTVIFILGAFVYPRVLGMIRRISPTTINT